jgi:hypothetical protein
MQHAPFEKPHSAKPIAVDIDGEPKGVLLALDAGFRFLAVKFDAFGVDGRCSKPLKPPRRRFATLCVLKSDKGCR